MVVITGKVEELKVFVLELSPHMIDVKQDFEHQWTYGDTLGALKIANFKLCSIRISPWCYIHFLLQLWSISWMKEIRFTLWPDLMAFSDKSAEEELRLPGGQKVEKKF